jgi:predicted alpha/beta-fold hydrolase
MIPSRDLERVPRLANLDLTLSRHGGHCGFIINLRGESWLAREVLAELERDR